jgi:pimeloyl-ACP methyl ester carboxylesterase
MAEVKRVTLSYREDAVGGEVSARPKISDELAIKQAQHLVLLIHGYNNDTQAAKDAYEGFHARQRDLDAGERYGIGLTFVEVYWPGDAAWGFASFLFYMGSIKRAIKTAGHLADYLTRNIGNLVRIDIVAHSMGCRLATELLRTLGNQPITPQIERIVFMAGAIPTFMLEQRNPSRRLRPSYDQVLRDGARSLYSGSDMVLALAFPAGQSLAPGEEGFLPTALGHAKWTDPTVPNNLDQQQNPGAGHGDYWGWNDKPKPLKCATKAAQEVRSYLQFPSSGSRTMNERSMVENIILEARINEAQREIIGRDIPVYA